MYAIRSYYEILLGISFAFISGSDSALLFETLRQQGRETDYARIDGRMTGCAQAGEAAGALFAGALYAASPLLPFVIQIGVWVLALTLCRAMQEPPRITSYNVCYTKLLRHRLTG